MSPTYNYKCTDDKCEHRFQEMESINADAQTKCPKCEKDTLIRVITYTGPVVYKGTGWTKKA